MRYLLIWSAVKWIFVDYFKPGSDLAREVSGKLMNRPDADVVFMGNHGVVIGGRSVDDAVATLHTLIFKLKNKTVLSAPESIPAACRSDFFVRGYIPCVDREVNLLALKDELVNRLRHEWALYPDHVVFLGAEPVILERNFTMHELDESAHRKPPFIIAVGDGVYESHAATPAQKSQIRCYLDVVSRQDGKEMLTSLNKLQVSELLDWDAEKYRNNLTDIKQEPA